MPKERSEVGIDRANADGEGSHQEGIPSEIGEGHDAAPWLASGELLRERLRVCAEMAESRDVDQDELELAIDARACHGRGFPAVRFEGSVE